jgi:hypothetical protein
METISENPPRKKRGRPSIFSDQERQGLPFVMGQRSPRQYNNGVYALRAMRALSGDARFAWLCSDLPTLVRGEGNYRGTILAELGRIADPEVREALALAICERQPTVRQARAMISQFRLPTRPPGTLNQLFTVLCNALNTYLAEHAAMSWDDISSAALALQAEIEATRHEAGDA